MIEWLKTEIKSVKESEMSSTNMTQHSNRTKHIFVIWLTNLEEVKLIILEKFYQRLLQMFLDLDYQLIFNK